MLGATITGRVVCPEAASGDSWLISPCGCAAAGNASVARRLAPAAPPDLTSAAPPTVQRPVWSRALGATSPSDDDREPDPTTPLATAAVAERFLPDGSFMRTSTTARVSPGVLPLDALAELAGGEAVVVTCGALAAPPPATPRSDPAAAAAGAQQASQAGREGTVRLAVRSRASRHALASALSARAAPGQPFRLLLALVSLDCADAPADVPNAAEPASPHALYLAVHSLGGAEDVTALRGEAPAPITLRVREVGVAECFSSPGSVHLLAVHADHLAPAVDALLAEQAGLGGESAAASAHPALPAVLVGEDGQTRLTPEVLHRAVGRALWERDAAYAGCAPGACPHPRAPLRRRLESAPEEQEQWARDADAYVARARSLSAEESADLFAAAFPGRHGPRLGVRAEDAAGSTGRALSTFSFRTAPEFSFGFRERFSHTGTGTSISTPGKVLGKKTQMGSKMTVSFTLAVAAQLDVSAHLELVVAVSLLTPGFMGVARFEAGIEARVSGGVDLSIDSGNLLSFSHEVSEQVGSDGGS
jgi:hypothetical protein